MGEVRIRRVYETSADDGYRALVDRLWPRGVRREDAALDAWWKDIAPSPELRTAWHHEPDRFDDFAAAYRAELDAQPFVEEALGVIREHDVVTLLFGARDEHRNHAAVLRDYLRERESTG